MRIENLRDRPDLLETLARWRRDEWGGDVEWWAEDLRAHLGSSAIPVTFVALESHEPVGSVSLIEHNMDTHLELTPWLAATYVVAAHRRRGIGSALVAHAVEDARRSGCARLHLYTESARGFYERLGWRRLFADEYEGERVDVMALDL